MKKRLECQRRCCGLPNRPGPARNYSYPWLHSASREVWMPGSGNDKEEKKDLEYWKQLYPAEVRQVQREVEHQCDLMDYSGSVIYDEYPDRIALSRICEAVYQALMQERARGAMEENPSGMPSAPSGRGIAGMEEGGKEPVVSEEEMEEFIMPEEEPEEIKEQTGPMQPLQMESMQYRGNDRSLQDMIEVLLYHEIHRRRCARRRGRSWYFG